MKNVKGYIGLFLGLASFVLSGIALGVMTNKIEGTSISLYSGFNSTIALIAALVGIAAIVFGIMSLKDKDKKGPRKAGIIVGIFAVIIGFSAMGICSCLSAVADYANGVPGNALSQVDESSRAQIDEALKQLREADQAAQSGETVTTTVAQ